MSMHRFFAEAIREHSPQPGKHRWHYRIRDKDQCRLGFGAKTIATILDDAEMADRICDMLNGGHPDDIEAVRAELETAREGLRRVHAAYDRLRADLIEMTSKL